MLNDTISQEIQIRILSMNNTSSFGSFTLFLLILIIIVCLCCICYYFISKANQYETTTDNNQMLLNGNDIYTLNNNQLNNPNNTYYTNNNPRSSTDLILTTQIHIHLSELLEIIKEIRKSSSPHIIYTKCLICMQPFQQNVNSSNNNGVIQQTPLQLETNTQYIEMVSKPTINEYQSIYPSFDMNSDFNQINTRFGCSHLYHSQCLSNHNLSCCLMCPGNSKSRDVVVNDLPTQVLDEVQVKTFIKNINFIYKQNDLNDYATTYPNEYDTFNTALMLGLCMSWGIPQGNGNVYVNNNYTIYNYTNTDSASPTDQAQQYITTGLYQAPLTNNVNMNENEVNAGTFINEGNNNVIGGDFGGNYGNDDVIGGSYGGDEEGDGGDF